MKAGKGVAASRGSPASDGFRAHRDRGHAPIQEVFQPGEGARLVEYKVFEAYREQMTRGRRGVEDVRLVLPADRPARSPRAPPPAGQRGRGGLTRAVRSGVQQQQTRDANDAERDSGNHARSFRDPRAPRRAAPAPLRPRPGSSRPASSRRPRRRRRRPWLPPAACCWTRSVGGWE